MNILVLFLLLFLKCIYNIKKHEDGVIGSRNKSRCWKDFAV